MVYFPNTFQARCCIEFAHFKSMFSFSKYLLRQIITVLPVFLIQTLFGIGTGWIAPILSKAHHADLDITLNDDEESWMASVHLLGQFFGPLLATPLLDNAGRKNTLLLTAIGLFLSYAGLIFSKSVGVIYSLRFIFGVSVGISNVASSIYLSENLSPKLRGILGSVVIGSYFAGISLEYALGVYLSYRALNLVNSLMALLTLLSQYVTVETPYFLTMKRKHEQAEQNYNWLHGVEADTSQKELDNIKENAAAERQKKASVTTLLSAKENTHSLMIVLGLYIFTSASGNGSLPVYSTLILESTESFSANELNAFYGVAVLLAICVSPFIVERFSRRMLIIVVYAFCSICNVSISILFYVRGTPNEIPYHAWLVFVLMTIESTMMALTYSAVYILRGELFPLSIKAYGGSAAIMVLAMVHFLTNKMFVLIVNRFGMQMNFFIYFVMNVLVVLHTFILLPETRGKSLIEIQKSLK